MLPTEEKRKQIAIKGRIREFVFGIQDGLISVVGLLAGMQAAGSSRFVILMAGTAAICSGAFSMSAGAYLSAKAEKEIFDYELNKEAKFVDREPYLAEEGLLEALHQEGLARETGYRIVQLLHQRKSVFVATFQEKVLGLGSADVNNPLKGALVMALSFILGGVIPLIPFIFLPLRSGLMAAVLLTGVVLFGVGMFKGRLAGQSLGRSGLEFLAIALLASGLGYSAGLVLEHFAGTPLPVGG
ncbi:MAG: VIT1/CCC1 transporter family protein [Sulfuricaulis sp.]